MVYIYILQLEQKKYYVGKTINPSFRMDTHFTSNGSAWTKLYNPIKMIELIPDCDDYDEDKYTLMFMEKYGIENVRGGSFVSVKLKPSTIEHLNLMINGSSNRCFICKNLGHFAKDCEQKNETDSFCDETFVSVKQNKDEPCNCPTSYFSGHKKSKCLLTNTLKIIDEISNELSEE
jgi:hypothetical protein